MDPLTPNTSAFLSYLSSSLENHNSDSSFQQDTSNTFSPFDMTKPQAPGSLPPSAFFPMPGRDTPEDTPPSSKEATLSPENNTNANNTTHETESEDEVTQKSGNKANHKRKAGQGQGQHKQVDEDEEEEDLDTDDASGHEDKRVHQNGKAPGGNKKGGRKSIGGEEGKGGKDTTKAARRKEQNRAAQKAFRERREAKVKDLEDKLAELEQKSYGTSVENENLRGILKRLQEENVALRQAAFTFSMPVNGAAQAGTGANTPIANVQQQQSKPPTPPHSISDDSLRSIHDVQGPSSRKSSTLNEQSPDSIASTGSGSGSESNGNNQPVNLFSDPTTFFNNSALGYARPSMVSPNSTSTNSTTQDGSSAPSGPSPSSSTDRTELDALWASFLQQGAPQKEQTPPASGWNHNNNGSSAFPMYSANQGPTSFANAQTKVGSTNNNFDKFAFRDNSAQPAPQSSTAVPAQDPTGDPWSSMMDNSVDDFLASLVGNDTNPVDNEGGVSDADFNAQIAQILGSNNASPSDAFNLPGQNLFSPTNYLNMSPSPAASGPVSTGASPHTNSASSASASMSPESISGNEVTRTDSLGSGISTFGPAKSEADYVYVVDEAGKVIKPSELWVRMGMQHESNLEHLLIDDLCDMMRSKATCQDGKKVLAAKDAETMFRFKGSDPAHDARMRDIANRAGVSGSLFASPNSK